MDGKAVFRFAVDALPKCLHTVLDETQLTLDDLEWVVCHQANSRIIDHCVRALKADPAKFYKNMDRHGNTSAASIPVALNELAENGQLQPGQLLACIGFGGGLTWGGAIFSIQRVKIMFGKRARLSVTFGDSSPKVGAFGQTEKFTVLPRALPLGELLSRARLRGRGRLPIG